MGAAPSLTVPRLCSSLAPSPPQSAVPSEAATPRRRLSRDSVTSRNGSDKSCLTLFEDVCSEGGSTCGTQRSDG
eukprot:1013891-Prymnesium_polylepis.1